MKFYLDFEATQFSNQIISIGCVAESGATFYTLVQPHKKKVTKFITELTGITNDMLADAPNANHAFNMFFDWVVDTNDNTVPQYFCYGDQDCVFINNTISHMSNTKAICFAASIKALLTDYSAVVKDFFNIGLVSLQKVFSLVHGEVTIQRHDALEDAMMLREVVEKMHVKCAEGDASKLPHTPAKQIKHPKSKRAPEIFINWPNDKFNADTRADEGNYRVKCYAEDGQCKYFDSINTAALWTIKYVVKHRSPKNQGDINAVVNEIIKSDAKHKQINNFYFEIKRNGEKS